MGPGETLSPPSPLPAKCHRSLAKKPHHPYEAPKPSQINNLLPTGRAAPSANQKNGGVPGALVLDAAGCFGAHRNKLQRKLLGLRTRGEGREKTFSCFSGDEG
jgi:hypothetical protein